MSEKIEEFSKEHFCDSDSASTEADFEMPASSPFTTARGVFEDEDQSVEESQRMIDDIFAASPNKPMYVWRGHDKKLLSIHFNECFLNLIEYTPEQFQIDSYIEGIPT